MSQPQASVAIAIVSWNTRDLLDRCLRSLEPEAAAGRAQVWVVDNGSHDGSQDMVRERHPWARLVVPDTNLGFGPAVNLVAGRTSTPWIAPSNADIELTPGALDALLAAGRDDPQAGAVAPRLLLPDGSTQQSVRRFPTLGFTLAFNLGLYRLSRRLGESMLLDGLWDPERARRVDWAVGAFLLVRRDAWEQAGGFDEAQWMYAEDVDLGWRLARAGRPTRYVPEAVVHHHESAATGAVWGGARVERWMRATYRWMLRRRGRPRTVAVAAVNVAGARWRWALYAARARVQGGPWADRSAQNREWARLHALGFRRPEHLEEEPSSGPPAAAST